MVSKRKSALAVGVAVLATQAGMAITAGSASAESTFNAFATATGIRGTVYNSSLPLGITYELNAPFSATRLTSLGQSDAVASSVYPGETVAGIPGLAGALGGAQTLPYPLAVNTQLGDDPRDLNYGVFTMHAESAAQHAIAKAAAGNDSGGLVTTSRVTVNQDDGASATAESSGDVLRIGDVLRLSGYRSVTSVTADGLTGELTRSSSLSITRLSVPGLRYQIPCTTPSSIPLLNPVPGLPQPPPINLPANPIPAPFGCAAVDEPDIGFADGQFVLTIPFAGGPQKYPVPSAGVFDAFKAAGVVLEYQPAQKLATGIQGEGFTFKMDVPAPPDNQYYKGTTPVTYNLGQGVATVDLRTSGGAGFGNAAGTSGGDVLSADDVFGTATEPGAFADGIGDPAVAPGVDAAAGSLTGLGIAGSGAIGTDQGAADAGNSTVTLVPAAATATAADSSDNDMANMYLVLVLTAAVGFGAVTLLRLVGVRFLWS